MASSLISTPASLTFRSKDGTHAGHIRSFTDNDIAAIKAAQANITNLQNRVVALDDDRFIVMSTEPATADNGKIWIKAGRATKTVTKTLNNIIPAGSLSQAVVEFSSEPASSFSDEALTIPAVVPNTIVTFSASLEASASNNLTISTYNTANYREMPFASFSLEDNTGFGYYGDPFTDSYVKLYYGEFESTTNANLTAAQIATATVVAKFVFPQIEYESVAESITAFALSALDRINVTYSNSNDMLGWASASWTMTDPTVTYTTWAD